MSSLSMESVFLILSGVILAAGVLYWFWSHIQLTQKKVQLLENAVFELRGLVGSGGGGGAAAPEGAAGGIYADLSDDDWEEAQVTSTPLEAAPQADAVADDLQPGGAATAAADAASSPPSTEERFRALFNRSSPASPVAVAASASPFAAPAASSSPVAAAAPPPESSQPAAEPLENMPVRELRRLGEQRGLTGVADMKKKEILAALRAQITSVPTAAGELSSVGGGADIVVEKSLDLDAMDAEALPLE